MKMTRTVLVFLIRNHKSSKPQVLLGTRKTGEGIGQYNGIGGKCHSHENLVNAAIREIKEEINVTIKPQDLKHIAQIKYQKPINHCTSDVFIVHKWQGVPKTSKEIIPQWFDTNKIPYHNMWPNDQLWLPKVLNREKLTATFWRDENGKMLKYKISSSLKIKLLI